MNYTFHFTVKYIRRIRVEEKLCCEALEKFDAKGNETDVELLTVQREKAETDDQ